MIPHPARPGPEDQKWFRRVLGQFPTGVTLVTTDADGHPEGMIVGSFTSVSLDPPLVAFYPGKTSTTWPKVEKSGTFCVNVIGAEQEHVCQAMMSKTPNKFDQFEWVSSEATGSPALKSAVAWIDCRIKSVTDGGDHWIVLGEVIDLDIGDQMPLLFFRGGFGRFETGLRVATETDYGPQLHALNRIRSGMERLATRYDRECIAAAHMDDEIVLMASAGPASTRDLPSRVGERVPALAPFGRSIIAWESQEVIDGWLSRIADPKQVDDHRLMLEAMRQRGYSVSVTSAEGSDELVNEADRPDLRTALDPGMEWLGVEGPETVSCVSVPVLDATGMPLFAIAVYGLPDGYSVDAVVADLNDVASAAASNPRRTTGSAS